MEPGLGQPGGTIGPVLGRVGSKPRRARAVRASRHCRASPALCQRERGHWALGSREAVSLARSTRIRRRNSTVGPCGSRARPNSKPVIPKAVKRFRSAFCVGFPFGQKKSAGGEVLLLKRRVFAVRRHLRQLVEKSVDSD